MMSERTGHPRTALGCTLAAVLCLCCPDIDAAGGLIAPAYSLETLTQDLRQAPTHRRAALARIALEELSTAYAQEALQARVELAHQPRDGELERWSSAVEALAARLSALAETVTSSTPIYVDIGPEHSLYLVVDGEPVVVNGPRTTRQSELEQRIIKRFCSQHPCVRAPAASVQAVPPEHTSAVNTHWSFSEAAGPVCSSGDGLDFAFRDSDRLVQKRDSCTRAIAELHALAEAIANQVAAGSAVHWDALTLYGRAGADSHQVQINHQGERLQLHLPLLAEAPRLLSQARPWLEARLEHRAQRVVFEQAERLLPLPPLPE